MTTLARILVIMICFCSCNREAFVETKVSLEEKGKDCNDLQPGFRLLSNFGGERFEFEKCLPAGYDNKALAAQRKGDTVVVNFNGGTNTSTVYAVTLDIDSYPSYRFITIDGETYTVAPTEE